MVQGLAGVRPGQQALQYRQLVGALNDVAHHEVDTWLTEQTDMTEPYVARCLSQMLPSGGFPNLELCAHPGKRITGWRRQQELVLQWLYSFEPTSRGYPVCVWRLAAGCACRHDCKMHCVFAFNTIVLLQGTACSLATACLYGTWTCMLHGNTSGDSKGI